MGTLKEVRSAIERISGAKLDPNGLSEMLQVALQRPEPEVLRLACIGLSRMRSRTAVLPLINLLYHSDPTVVEAAHGALIELTEMKLPAEPQLWSLQTASR